MSLGKGDWAALVYIAPGKSLGAREDDSLRRLGAARVADPDETGVRSSRVGAEIGARGASGGSTRYEIQDNGRAVAWIQLPEQVSGDRDAFGRFLRWGLERFSAERKCLVIRGHGDGFKRDPGVASEEEGGLLDILRIVSTLERVGVGASAGARLEVLGFDACLMGMVEIAFALRSHARFMVASQAEVTGKGWPLETVLPALRHVTTGAALGETIVSSYMQQCREARATGVTMSAIDLHRVGDVMVALGALGRVLATMQGEGWVAVTAARDRVLSFAMPDYVDLVDLCRHLEGVPAFEPAARNLRQAAEGAILKSDCFGITVEGARGLSVWFPTISGVYARHRESYLALAPGDATLLGWVSFLDRYHTATTGAPAPT